MCILKKHQVDSFFSQVFLINELSLSPISEPLRRLQKYMALFSYCHSFPPLWHPVWCSSWPFLILKQKSQVLKFTGPEVFVEDLLNSLGPGISLFSFFCRRQSWADCLLLPGAVKQRDTNNRAVAIPARSLFVAGVHTVSSVDL